MKQLDKLRGMIKEVLSEMEPDPDFLDKVEDNISTSIIDDLSESILTLRDIQKRLVKFRPKLINEIARATDQLEVVQGKLTDGENIEEGKEALEDLIKQRNEVNKELDKIVQSGGKISDPLYIKSKALTSKINYIYNRKNEKLFNKLKGIKN